MPRNLLALCGRPGEAVIKRVRTSADVQAQLEGFFAGLDAIFRDGVEVERPYDSRWTPGPDELATIPASAEVVDVISRVQAGVLGLVEITGSDFEAENIRALAVYDEVKGVLYAQTFNASQRLSRRYALISNSNEFNRLDKSAFTLSNQIDVVVENGLIKFRSYHIAKRVFDIAQFYKEATDAEIRQFAQHALIEVDADNLIALATQPLRKLISSVQDSGVLDRETADSLQSKAANLVPVVVQNGKLVVPLTKPELKDLMAFLDHKIYRSPVDDDPYETNSHRRRGG